MTFSKGHARRKAQIKRARDTDFPWLWCVKSQWDYIHDAVAIVRDLDMLRRALVKAPATGEKLYLHTVVEHDAREQVVHIQPLARASWVQAIFRQWESQELKYAHHVAISNVIHSTTLIFPVSKPKAYSWRALINDAHRDVMCQAGYSSSDALIS